MNDFFLKLDLKKDNVIDYDIKIQHVIFPRDASSKDIQTNASFCHRIRHNVSSDGAIANYCLHECILTIHPSSSLWQQGWRWWFWYVSHNADHLISQEICSSCNDRSNTYVDYNWWSPKESRWRQNQAKLDSISANEGIISQSCSSFQVKKDKKKIQK